LSYQSESVRNALTSRDSASIAKSVTPRVVYWIGLTSMLTDISTEMIASTLPVFMFSVLNLSPLQVGFIDGLYQGAAAIVRVAAGYIADAKQNNRIVAFLGYFLSFIARIGFLFASMGGMLVVLIGLLADRIGKGIRSAPRDALIAGHTAPAGRAAAFGVHRTMDAVGAFVGPLIAAGVLWWKPQGFEILFVASLIFSATGLVVFWWRVPEAPRETARKDDDAGVNESLTAEPATAHEPVPQIFTPVHQATIKGSVATLLHTKRFMQLMILAVILSIFTISDGLIYVSLQRTLGADEQMVPLMFVATAFVFLLTALPIGRLADRIGCVPVLLAGYGMLTLAYLWFAFGMGGLNSATLSAASYFQIAGLVCLLGVHYAATDGVLAALAVSYLPAHVRTTGLAALTTAIGLTRIGSSTLFGWTWQNYSQTNAATLFAVGMLICFVAIVTMTRFGLLQERRAS
jgi:MFS family permease